jgi:hypothetical protein
MVRMSDDRSGFVCAGDDAATQRAEIVNTRARAIDKVRAFARRIDCTSAEERSMARGAQGTCSPAVLPAPVAPVTQ